jgi:hypothetical protein
MRLVAIGATAIMVTFVAACGGGSSKATPIAAGTTTSTAAVPSTTAPSPTTTALAPTTTTPAPTTTAPAPTTTTTAAVNYGQQFLDDESGWDAAIKAAVDSGLATPKSLAAGRQAVDMAHLLLTQSWPAADVSDIHALAAQFDLINEDIQFDDHSKYVTDGTQLNADANVVRAELGLPAIR